MFYMPALALRFTSGRNGVAELHGATSRRIRSDLWLEVPTDEIPIGHVTNGVHATTWVAPEIDALLDPVLPAEWRSTLGSSELREAMQDVDNKGLWQVRQDLESRSIRFLRRRVRQQYDRQEASASAMQGIGELFDEKVLTIGFARRFATYKRATLIFRDLDRLAALLNDPGRPVQLVFAGKPIRPTALVRRSLPRSRPCRRSPVSTWPDPVPRGLQHGCRQGTDQGGRRMARQPPPTARSLRHERSESGHERHPEPQHSRRLVA